MKSIKSFKHFGKRCFKYFLKDCGRPLEDVKGFSFAKRKQYRGNVLKTYSIKFKDGKKEYFKAAYFKDFNEYHQSSLGFKGNKLLRWWEDSDVKAYKKCNETIFCC